MPKDFNWVTYVGTATPLDRRGHRGVIIRLSTIRTLAPLGLQP